MVPGPTNLSKKVQEELLLPHERIAQLDKVSAELKAIMALPLDYAKENTKLDTLKAKMVVLADLINDTIDAYEMGEAA
jgi:hypothetical protein